MASARIMGASWADDATITATSEAMDADNLKDTDVRKVWRSSGLADQTITMDFGSTKQSNVLHLENINLSSAGAYTLELSDDNFATIVYSENFGKWADDLAHAAATHWFNTGGHTLVDGNGDAIVDGNGDPIVSATWTLPVSARYARIIVEDASNADGYLEIGRIKIGRYFDAPNSKNVAVGPGLDYVERGALLATRGGGFRSENKTPQRRLRVAWQWVHPTDAYTLGGNEFAELLRVTGHRSDVLLSVYPEDGESDRERLHTVLGRITDRSEIQGTELIKEGADVLLYSQLSLEVTEAI